jgi:hypothetical protein
MTTLSGQIPSEEILLKDERQTGLAKAAKQTVPEFALKYFIKYKIKVCS